MNVLQVLAITTALYLVFVILWVTKIEDWLEQREREQGESA